MNASRQLDQYLESFRQRLRKLTLIQGIAATSIVLLLVSVAGAWFARESGFDSATVITARVLLLLALAGVTLRFITLPLRRLKQHIAGRLEERSPAFQGRIETYEDLRQANNPMADLLAEDALKVSRQYPVEEQVQLREFNLATAVTGLTLAILVYLLIAGPGMLNYSLRNLFAGWAVGEVLPPQVIAVDPGDRSVRRGSNLRITSTMEGFDPDEATIHVRGEGESWQEVDMVNGPEGFEFTFFSLQEPMEYYVSTTGMRSPAYDIQVVDLPDLESLSLTYHYPEWSQREPETIEPGGDIRTLPDTRVELTATTSSPLDEGRLVLNSEARDMTIEGNEASTDFTVTEEGKYYVAAMVGNEEVRLSDDYFIRITEDGRPVIDIVRPGRDWNATNIEEVLTRVEASDDYGLERVTLNYSINGGDWQGVELNEEKSREVEAEHLFMLEDMRTEVARPLSTEGSELGAFTIVRDEETDSVELQEAEAPVQEVPLKPGDLISYYAEAEDRSNVERTDMYFIQVQRYNRRYSQSQLSGGGGGGQQGGPQDEISQRQRQIIVSTWNLIREQEEDPQDGSIQVNSSLISDLQNTLAEQAQTLAERSRARQLTQQDEQIAEFINSMELAVQSMYPAAEHLASVELEAALQPAQEALQYLLQAESVFNEMEITQQQGGGGGGAGQAQRDLAEMFELELDMEKNQYETGNRASSAGSQQEQADDLMEKLDELAQRQEQLANNMRNQNQVTDAQRWQQEMLRREAEELQQELEQLQRDNQQGQQQNQQQASNQQGQQQEGQQPQGGQQQGGQQGGQGQSGQQGQSQQQANQQSQDNQQLAQSELQRRLDSAIRAMNENSEAMRNNAGVEELQRSSEEAQRQLEGARDQVAQQQMESMQDAFTSMAGQASDMLRDQQDMQRQLQQAMDRAVAERESGENPESRGMSLAEEWQLARDKQELATQIQQLQQQMLSTLQQFEDKAPEATRELRRANDQLVESELEQAVSDAALYIDSGYGLYIAGNESNVTRSMENLNRSLQQAQQLASNSDNRGETDLARAIAQARDLRSQMQEEMRNQQGQGQSQGQEGEPGQSGQQQESSQAGQGGQQGGQSRTAASNGGSWANNGPQADGPLELPEDFFSDLDNLTQAARAAIPEMNLGSEQLAAMYDLVRELEFTRANRNDEILAQEYNSMLTLIEQLEVNLQLDDEGGSGNNVRTAIQESIPEEYRDNVAEYYRRLSEGD